MDTLTVDEVPEMFAEVAKIFAEKKEELCKLDAALGDGDLGLTMNRGFGALPRFLREAAGEGDIGKQFMKAGMKMQNAVPSTMGTLMSSGLIQAGRTFKGRTSLAPSDLVIYVRAFAEGIQKRGKCVLGDCTILDSIDAAAKKADAYLESNTSASFSDIASTAAEGAAEGVEATKHMVPKFGKALVHAAKAEGVVDQGALAGYYLLLGIKNYFVS